MYSISDQLLGYSSFTIISVLYSLPIESKVYTASMLSGFMTVVVVVREKTALSQLVKRIMFFKFFKTQMLSKRNREHLFHYMHGLYTTQKRLTHPQGPARMQSSSDEIKFSVSRMTFPLEK